MIRRWYDALCRTLAVLCAVFAIISVVPTAAAAPFGSGAFGGCPFGASGHAGSCALPGMAVSLSGNVTIDLVPSGATFVGSGSHTLTVTTTDATGYKLYIYSPGGTSMTSGTDTIAASSNGAAAPLAINTWGYNIDGSSDYIGMTTTPALLRSASGEYPSGDDTTVTYGVLTDITKSEGTYTVSVTYTAVAINY